MKMAEDDVLTNTLKVPTPTLFVHFSCEVRIAPRRFSPQKYRIMEYGKDFQPKIV